MILDNDTLKNLTQYINLIENKIILTVSLDNSEESIQLNEFIQQIKELNSLIAVETKTLERTPSFSINNENETFGITFAGIPLGHELTSFILALLQVGGRKPKIDEDTIKTIQSIKTELKFETYVSLTCHNCPDTVQALNIFSLLNKNISHTMIDGSIFKDEVEKKQIMAVPSIYLNGEFWESGKLTVEEIIKKLNIIDNNSTKETINNKDPYDVLIIGGGPAGASAAIYSARKGIRTAIVAERFGGQIMDTLSIENFISTKETDGPKLAKQLEEHVKAYDVEIISLQKAKQINKKENLFYVSLENGGTLKAKSIILATGAKWRNLNIPGENEFKNKGVAYCPHCDGPLFKGKNVAVIGGGNSGVEAAIDLAGIVKHVTLLEFGNELKADAILQKRVEETNNITVITNAQTLEINGKTKVESITYKNRKTDEITTINLDGVFVQIGLVPNTEWLSDIELAKTGEIIINKHGETNISGIFAAGDCTNIPYKQIIIAMGEGAKASLGAFDYLVRNK